MTIRRLWLMILILVSVLSVAVNTFILTTLTDHYFKDYLAESYETHISQVLQYTQKVLLNEKTSYQQMRMEYEVHLIDPIIGLKLYDPSGELLVEVEDDYYLNNDMMSGMMANRMNSKLRNDLSNEMRQYDIVYEDEVIAVLNVTVHSMAENSFVANHFKASLLTNSLISLLMVTLLVLVIGIIVSKKMSKSLQETADLASSIQIGEATPLKKTSIKEINAIRDSLEELDTRLKLKQKSRKSLVDELMHQTRTPLTILKSHIEAIEDGLIEVKDEELEICQNQISNLTSIISNLSGMIDANKEVDNIKIESFEIKKMLNQIISGLRPQFNKKSIKLELLSNDDIRIESDQYKLSQSIFNILTNAYKYSETNASVKISYSLLENRLLVKIKDTGLGISELDQKKIFDAYYRADNALKSSGHGIGLYIVKENIKMLGGQINLVSTLGVGSTFEIDIPVKYK